MKAPETKHFVLKTPFPFVGPAYQLLRCCNSNWI